LTSWGIYTTPTALSFSFSSACYVQIQRSTWKFSVASFRLSMKLYKKNTSTQFIFSRFSLVPQLLLDGNRHTICQSPRIVS